MSILYIVCLRVDEYTVHSMFVCCVHVCLRPCARECVCLRVDEYTVHTQLHS